MVSQTVYIVIIVILALLLIGAAVFGVFYMRKANDPNPLCLPTATT